MPRVRDETTGHRLPEHQLDQVLARVRSIGGRPVVLAIDGRSGSGKTTLAAAVCAALGDACVIHLDDIYPGWDGLAATPPLLVAQVLVALRRGEPATYRRFDWEQGTFADALTVPRTRFVVVEGAGSSVGIARRYADVRVWLEAATSVRRRRGLDRDGEAYAPHWQRWADQEDAVFGADRTRDHAHLVFRTD
ncbi:AAA family ATPase [Flexivirga lutea]